MIRKAAGKLLKAAGKRAAKNAGKKLRAGAARAKKAAERLAGEALENPGYDEHGASFDLFGGESRKLPKKAKEFSRPRVKVHGHTVTFAKHSPFKGKVERANPARGKMGARVVVAPLRVELSAAEVRTLEDGKWPSPEMVAKILAGADKRRGWDHIEVTGPTGRHLFDLIP